MTIITGKVLAWLSAWIEAHMICTNPIISCFIKIQNGLPFWCRLAQILLEKNVVKWM